MAPLKPKYACFACRKMFRIASARFTWDKDLKMNVTEHPPVCPDCGALMRNVGRYFKPPRRDNKQAWEAAELFYLSKVSPWNWGKPIRRLGQAKRHIAANPNRASEGARLLAKYRNRKGK
jgi:hypothetical protein